MGPLAAPGAEAGGELLGAGAAVDWRDDESLFVAVDKLVDAAAAASQLGQHKRAAVVLRRAFDLTSAKVTAGLLAARAARASVALHYCALLSHCGHHDSALEEAEAAAREADEVWALLAAADRQREAAQRRGEVAKLTSPYGALLQEPPKWIERAIVALVQAKHCLALEMEFSAARLATDPRDTIAALHHDGAAIAVQLLPPDSEVRQLSERTAAKAQQRQGGGGQDGAESPARATSGIMRCSFQGEGRGGARPRSSPSKLGRGSCSPPRPVTAAKKRGGARGAEARGPSCLPQGNSCTLPRELRAPFLRARGSAGTGPATDPTAGLAPAGWVQCQRPPQLLQPPPLPSPPEPRPQQPLPEQLSEKLPQQRPQQPPAPLPLQHSLPSPQRAPQQLQQKQQQQSSQHEEQPRQQPREAWQAQAPQPTPEPELELVWGLLQQKGLELSERQPEEQVPQEEQEEQREFLRFLELQLQEQQRLRGEQLEQQEFVPALELQQEEGSLEQMEREEEEPPWQQELHEPPGLLEEQLDERLEGQPGGAPEKQLEGVAEERSRERPEERPEAASEERPQEQQQGAAKAPPQRMRDFLRKFRKQQQQQRRTLAIIPEQPAEAPEGAREDEEQAEQLAADQGVVRPRTPASMQHVHEFLRHLGGLQRLQPQEQTEGRPAEVHGGRQPGERPEPLLEAHGPEEHPDGESGERIKEPEEQTECLPEASGPRCSERRRTSSEDMREFLHELEQQHRQQDPQQQPQQQPQPPRQQPQQQPQEQQQVLPQQQLEQAQRGLQEQQQWPEEQGVAWAALRRGGTDEQLLRAELHRMLDQGQQQASPAASMEEGPCRKSTSSRPCSAPVSRRGSFLPSRRGSLAPSRRGSMVPGGGGFSLSNVGTERQQRDIFAEWLAGSAQGKSWQQKLNTEEGVKELCAEMKQESHRFRHVYLPSLDEQHIYDNRIHYSKYGMSVHRLAEIREDRREQEREASGGCRTPKRCGSASPTRRTWALKGALKAHSTGKATHARVVRHLARALEQSDKLMASALQESLAGTATAPPSKTQQAPAAQLKHADTHDGIVVPAAKEVERPLTAKRGSAPGQLEAASTARRGSVALLGEAPPAPKMGSATGKVEAPPKRGSAPAQAEAPRAAKRGSVAPHVAAPPVAKRGSVAPQAAPSPAKRGSVSPQLARRRLSSRPRGSVTIRGLWW